MYHVLDNIEDVKKTYFSIQKHSCCDCTLGNIHQYSFSENHIFFSKPLELIHSDLLELLILFYSKYKWIITFFDNYSYCNIAFLYKNSEATRVIESNFQMWSNTTFHSMKRLHIDNGREYATLEL